MEHLKSAVRLVEPSDIQSYEELATKFQRLVKSNIAEDKLDDQQWPSQSASIWYMFLPLLFCIFYFWPCFTIQFCSSVSMFV